jgi:hypothetical protein
MSSSLRPKTLRAQLVSGQIVLLTALSLVIGGIAVLALHGFLGLHGMHEESGEIELKAGEYDIKLEMFENEGEAGCKLSWEGPGVAKEVVPASALSHKKSDE